MEFNYIYLIIAIEILGYSIQSYHSICQYKHNISQLMWILRLFDKSTGYFKSVSGIFLSKKILEG